jgi:OmpA-OmpF porin, OOP family
MLKKIIPMAILAGVAHAGEESGPYAGISAGQSSFKQDVFGFSVNATDTAFKLFGGYQINRNLAVEGAYIDAGNAEDTVDGVTFGLDSSAFQASLRAILPFSPQFAGYVRGGILIWEGTATVSDGFSSGSADTDGNDFSWGLGLQFEFTERTQGRLEFEGAKTDGVDHRLITAGISWGFR